MKKLSADDRAKLEYEAREKAIRDYNSQMSSALRRGRKQGQLLSQIELIQKKCQKGKTLEQIADEMEEEASEIEKLYQVVSQNPEKTAEQLLQMAGQDM